MLLTLVRVKCCLLRVFYDSLITLINPGKSQFYQEPHQTHLKRKPSDVKGGNELVSGETSTNNNYLH